MNKRADPAERVRVNRPVRKLDLRAPAVVLLGLAGVAGAAALVRARRRPSPARAAGSDGGGGRSPPWRHAPAVLLAGAAITGNVLGRRGGRAGGLALLGPAASALASVQALLRGGTSLGNARKALQLASTAAGLVDLASSLKRSKGAETSDPVERARRAASLAATFAGLIGTAAEQRSGAGASPDGSAPPPDPARTVLGAGRTLRAAAALLALAVLTDSAMEHYRGSFHDPFMYAPLVSSSLSIAANLQGMAGGGTTLRRARNGVHLLSGTIGLVGLGFHLYNIGSRPGGYGWLNFFYAAPFGAPAALSLAGLIGWSAERLDPARPAGEQHILGLPFGRAMAGVVGFGLAGTVAEVALLHFRGAYHNPFMWLPVSLPPVSAALIAKAAFVPGDGAQALTRGWLWVTTLLGIGGVGFHAYGVSRNMGGWYNWSQNILAGPPLPAPPSFSALALAGLATLNLIDAERAAR